MLGRVVGHVKNAMDVRSGSRTDAAGEKSRDSDMSSAFLSSFFMIMVTEMGDETFIIAAIMAMRHAKAVVYAGAMSALALMTIISTALGYILPNLISRKATHTAATALYTFFGLRLYYIAYYAKTDVNEELEEVEAKLEQNEKGQSPWRRELGRICTPVFLEAFVLTFLAEWGDRSQIATISLAAQHDPYGVTVGAILGHSLCTGIAVMGGALLARRISQRTVAIAGGTLFLIFAGLNLFSRDA